MNRLGPDRVPALSNLALAVRSELDETPAREISSTAPMASDPSRLVLAVDDDSDLLDRLTAEGALRSLRVMSAASPADARAALDRETPDLVLLDLSFDARQEGEAMRLLAEFAAGSPSVPSWCSRSASRSPIASRWPGAAVAASSRRR